MGEFKDLELRQNLIEARHVFSGIVVILGCFWVVFLLRVEVAVNHTRLLDGSYHTMN